MTWERRLAWLATATALVLITIIAPRLSPARDQDPFPARVSTGESRQVGGGSVTIERVKASPRWTNGEDTLSLENERGVFVEVQAMAHPDREATFLKAVIRSKDRTYVLSDRLGSFNEQAEAGFDSPQMITFEVPEEVLVNGEIWMYFTEESAVRLPLRDADIKRVAVLEQQT